MSVKHVDVCKMNSGGLCNCSAGKTPPWLGSTPVTDKDVHTEHCCVRHGCKYNKINCTVAPRGMFRGRIKPKKQSFPCMVCDDELREGGLELAYLMNEMYDKGYGRGADDVERGI